MTGPVIAFTPEEVHAMTHGPGPVASMAYFVLRSMMDFATGIVGKPRRISLAQLGAYLETEITRGAGVQIERPTEKAVRVALGKLERAGLIRRIPGKEIVFLLPLALTGQIRPKQTGQEQGRVLSTEPGRLHASIDAGLTAEQGTTQNHPGSPNRAHFRFKEVQNHTARAVDNFSGNCTQPGQRRLTETKPDSTERLLQFGQRRGIEPRPGESWAEYRYRVTQAA